MKRTSTLLTIGILSMALAPVCIAQERTASSHNAIVHDTIEVDGVDIFYREAGPKDAPTLFLLHGYPTSSHMFRNLMRGLADKFHTLAPDFWVFLHKGT